MFRPAGIGSYLHKLKMHFEVLLSRAARVLFSSKWEPPSNPSGLRSEMRSLLQRSNLLSTATEHSRCRFAVIRVARRAGSRRPQIIGQIAAKNFFDASRRLARTLEVVRQRLCRGAGRCIRDQIEHIGRLSLGLDQALPFAAQLGFGDRVVRTTGW
jgi:hypothetical protein